MRMGRLKLPAAVPERHRALASDLLLSKYLAVRMIPGVVARPIPIPVRMPRVTNRHCRLGMVELSATPRNAKTEPDAVTYRQLNL